MNTDSRFRATFRDLTTRDIMATSVTHALALIADRDLLLSLEEFDEHGKPTGGIYAAQADGRDVHQLTMGL
jgi:hypothetical protein